MADIFISYSHQQSAFRQQLRERLESEKLTVWVDNTGLQIGMEWWAEIRKAIATANTFVFIMTADAWKSCTCMLEVAEAIQNNVRIISIKMISDEDVVSSIKVHQNYQPDEIFEAMLAKRNLLATAEANWRRLRELQWTMLIPGEVDQLEELVGAIRNDFGYNKQHAQLREKVVDWNQHHQNSTYLLQGLEITEAEKWIEEADRTRKEPQPSPLQREYVARSVRTQWITYIRILAALLIIALLAIGVIVVEQNRVITENLRRVIAASDRHVTGVNAYSLGQFQAAKGFFQSAIDEYNTVLRAYPQIAEGAEGSVIYLHRWYNDLGASCAQLGEYDCAETALRKAITLHPQVVEPTDLLPYLNLAAAYRDNNAQFDEALRVLDEAVENTTDDRLILIESSIDRLKGSILFADGKYSEALDVLAGLPDLVISSGFEDIRKVLSSDALEVLYYLAVSSQQIGNIPKACDYWDTYQELLLHYPPRRRWILDQAMLSDALTQIQNLESECLVPNNDQPSS